jgi:glucosyl-dolichyl phosphate glucuronosyltransferase
MTRATRTAPDVSVVISTCSRRPLLAAALDSLLLRQRVPADLSYEIVIVDNNSTDDTRPFVLGLVDRFPGRLRYVFEPRHGVSYGRNAGIRATRAPIIAFTDDDNEPDETWIATIVQVFARDPTLAAIGGKILPEWPSRVPAWLDRHHWSPLAILDYGDEPFYASAGDPRCLLTANLAVRRSAFDRLGAFSPEFPRCQDHELLIRLWRAGERVLYAPELVVRTRVPPERLTRRYHRAWHRRHGFFSAAMRLQEIIGARGELLDRPVLAARLYGTPGFVYRELWTELGLWATSAIRLRRSAASHHGLRVRYLVAYIARLGLMHLAEHGSIVGDAVRFVRAHLARRVAAVNMSRGRIAMAQWLVTGLVLGSAYDIVTDREHWPFSPYPMFSTLERDPMLRSLRVFGVVGGATEVPLRDGDWIEPFDQCRLTTALSGAYGNVRRRSQIGVMLRDCLRRYEEGRTVGRHNGPPLQAVRLYELTWRVDPHGARDPEASPSGRRLLAQVDAEGAATRP